jgi:VIT1/CCC1 family predicted Fe2+/Mn2+ transporter
MRDLKNFWSERKIQSYTRAEIIHELQTWLSKYDDIPNLPVERCVTRLAAQLRDFYASLRRFHYDPAEALVEAVNAMAALSRELSEIADEGVISARSVQQANAASRPITLPLRGLFTPFKKVR